MLCERCQKEEASIHLTEIIKDVKSEVHLCENCARNIGLNSKLANFSLSVPEMLSFLDISEVDESVDDLKCKTCGMSFVEYNKNGKLGCPECYYYLKESLENVILSYHGEKRHIGKFPAESPEPVIQELEDIEIETGQSLEDLKEELRKAVDDERYEDAAMLRDRINSIDNK